MLFSSALRTTQDGSEHTVRALGRYGNDVNSFALADDVRTGNGLGAGDVDGPADAFEDGERTCNFRGVLVLLPPSAADAVANIVAVSRDHLS